jgi:hypothetical protein
MRGAWGVGRAAWCVGGSAWLRGCLASWCAWLCVVVRGVRKCVCMSVWVWVCVYALVDVRVHQCACACAWWVCVCGCVCTSVRMRVRVRVRECICVRLCGCGCACFLLPWMHPVRCPLLLWTHSGSGYGQEAADLGAAMVQAGMDVSAKHPISNSTKVCEHCAVGTRFLFSLQRLPAYALMDTCISHTRTHSTRTNTRPLIQFTEVHHTTPVFGRLFPQGPPSSFSARPPLTPTSPPHVPHRHPSPVVTSSCVSFAPRATGAPP